MVTNSAYRDSLGQYQMRFRSSLAYNINRIVIVAFWRKRFIYFKLFAMRLLHMRKRAGSGFLL